MIMISPRSIAFVNGSLVWGRAVSVSSQRYATVRLDNRITRVNIPLEASF